jgi:hypothetical protein
MCCDVIKAEVTGALSFSVGFADGLRGVVEMQTSHLYGVFEKLKDRNFFSQLRVENGFVSWPGEIDLAPDAMYEAIKRDGRWILS